jgi:antitoxin CcdA
MSRAGFARRSVLFCAVIERFYHMKQTALFRKSTKKISHKILWNSRNLLIIRFCYTLLVILMTMEETVCAKVPAELKKKLSNLGVNVSELIRETLQSEVDRLERERLNKLAKEVSAILKKIPPDEFTESIRTARDSR